MDPIVGMFFVATQCSPDKRATWRMVTSIRLAMCKGIAGSGNPSICIVGFRHRYVAGILHLHRCIGLAGCWCSSKAPVGESGVVGRD